MRKAAYSSPRAESSFSSENDLERSGEDSVAYLLCKRGCRSNGRTILPHQRNSFFALKHQPSLPDLLSPAVLKSENLVTIETIVVR